MAVDISTFIPNSSALIGILIVVIILLVVLALVITGAIMYANSKRFNILVDVFYQPKGSRQPIKKHDSAGIFVNKKTNLKRFWLKKHKIGLNPDNVPFIINETGHKVVTLWQDGLSSFRYVVVNITDNPGLHFAPGEEDINWAIATYQEFKRLFDNNTSWFDKYGAAALFTVVIVVISIILIVLFQKFEVLGQVASSLDSAAAKLAEANAPTVIR